MPYKQEYNVSNVKKGVSLAPKSVMGNQGKSVNSKVSMPMYNKTKPTATTTFEAGTKKR